MKLSPYFTEEHNLRGNNPGIVDQGCDLGWASDYKLT